MDVDSIFCITKQFFTIQNGSAQAYRLFCLVDHSCSLGHFIFNVNFN